MRICQVTPGLISIPPNGWGAVEKIIWEYKQSFERAGHICDVKYLGDVNKSDYDVIHIHVANLALVAHERDIPYVFTMHDHHSEVYGVNSDLYKQNREAIEKSIVSFVPSQHLVPFFNSRKVQYVRHGVNSSFFIYDIQYLSQRETASSKVAHCSVAVKGLMCSSLHLASVRLLVCHAHVPQLLRVHCIL